MKPEEILGVVVRGFGLFLLFQAISGAIGLMVAFPVEHPIVLAIPTLQAVAGLIVIWFANPIVGFCYRWNDARGQHR